MYKEQSLLTYLGMKNKRKKLATNEALVDVRWDIQ